LALKPKQPLIAEPGQIGIVPPEHHRLRAFITRAPSHDRERIDPRTRRYRLRGELGDASTSGLVVWSSSISSSSSCEHARRPCLPPRRELRPAVAYFAVFGRGAGRDRARTFPILRVAPCARALLHTSVRNTGSQPYTEITSRPASSIPPVRGQNFLLPSLRVLILSRKTVAGPTAQATDSD